LCAVPNLVGSLYGIKFTVIGRTTVAAAVAATLLAAASSCVDATHAPGGGNDAALVPESGTDAYHGFLYGRVTTVDDKSYEGRLRWGGDQEAFWTDYFDGVKKTNPWAAHVPALATPGERRPIEVFGFTLGGRSPSAELARPFMVRFGDIARVEARLAEVQVKLKSGSTVVLNRFEAGDIDDGVRVWDDKRGIVDLDARQIRSVEFSATQPLSALPSRLHGTVRARDGEFNGFIQWDRQHYTGSDAISGRTPDGEVTVPFDTIRSIARHSRDSARVTLRDGRELVLAGTREVDHRNRGIAVDDGRYGRVVLAWSEFVSVEFSASDGGPGYEVFTPGQPLTGSIITRDGLRLSGRLVYDFDESETTDTFDVTSRDGVGYTIPLTLVASIVVRSGEQNGAPAPAVILRGGQEVRLERSGDLEERNLGVLVFIDGREQPHYVPWHDVAVIDLEAPDRRPGLSTRVHNHAAQP
jgi:hypothetical protein